MEYESLKKVDYKSCYIALVGWVDRLVSLSGVCRLTIVFNTPRCFHCIRSKQLFRSLFWPKLELAKTLYSTTQGISRLLGTSKPTSGVKYNTVTLGVKFYSKINLLLQI